MRLHSCHGVQHREAFCSCSEEAPGPLAAPRIASPPGAANRARDGARRADPRRLLLSQSDQRTVELEPRHTHRRVAARTRGGRRRLADRVDVLRADGAEQGWPDAASAPSRGRARRVLLVIGVGNGSNTVYRPLRVRPMILPALPGEGVWHPARAESTASAPILLTTLRNQPEYPRVVAGLAWIDTRRTTVTLRPRAPGAGSRTATWHDGCADRLVAAACWRLSTAPSN